VYFHPYHFERWFISAVHSEADVQRTLEAAYDAAEEVVKGG
jgi:glutamate-1-semialdehyde 2,1-aminomutase